jgi:lipopolysaccharide export system permease protein
MGRILFRYIVREIVTPFVLGLFIFTFVVFMMQILKMADWVVNYGVGLLEIGQILLYLLPPMFVFTVPMSFLLAVMLAVNRLSGDSEITAMKAAGVSLYQMAPPVLMLSMVVMSMTLGLTLFAEPWGKQSIKLLLFELGKERATLGITERVFNTDFDELVVFVNEVTPGSNSLKGVFIADERQGGAPNIIVASKGQIYSDSGADRLVLRLNDGSIHRTTKDADVYETAGFSQYDIVLDLNKLISDQVFKAAYHELDMTALSAHIKQLKADEGDSFDYRRAWVEYHRRFSFPFAAIIFGLIGLPLGLAPPRSGKSRGFSMAVATLCVYYLLFRVAENMGWKGVAHPALIMWAPNLLFAAAGALLLYKKANEQPIRSFEFVTMQLYRAKKAIVAKIFRADTRRGEGE